MVFCRGTGIEWGRISGQWDKPAWGDISVTAHESRSFRNVFLSALVPVGFIGLVVVSWMSARNRTEETVAWVRERGGDAALRQAGWLPVSLTAGLLEMPVVVQVDLSTAPGNDGDLERLAELESLESLAFRGPDVTDAGLAQLGRLPQLRQVVLINCPHVSHAAASRLERTVPGLRIRLRGPAFLGVSGMTAHPLGCVIRAVQAGSPAEQSGLRAGDIISGFDGLPITSFEQLADRIAECSPGDTAEIVAVRRGVTVTLPATLGQWE